MGNSGKTKLKLETTLLSANAVCFCYIVINCLHIAHYKSYLPNAATNLVTNTIQTLASNLLLAE